MANTKNFQIYKSLGMDKMGFIMITDVSADIEYLSSNAQGPNVIKE